MMYRLSAAVGLCLLTASQAFAVCGAPSIYDQLSKTTQQDLSIESEARPFAIGNFWRATRDDVQMTIVGTLHLPDPRMDAVVHDLAPLLSTADILLVEATLEDQLEMQTHLMSNPDLFTITEGPTLPDLLSPEVWDSLSAALGERGFPSFMSAKLQPWFAALSLSIPTCVAAQMQQGKAGLDALLMTMAGDTPIVSLEDWETTLALLSQGTIEEQVIQLEATPFDEALMSELLKGLVDDYFAGRSAQAWLLGRYSAELMPGVDAAMIDAVYAELERDLLTGRNHAWIPVLESTAQTHDNIMVAFGAAHLAGDDGVLNLLTQNGWTIRELP